jgi:uncharacterized protein YdcH (DUF465 family)
MRWLWPLLLPLLEAGDASNEGGDEDDAADDDDKQEQEEDEEIRDPGALIKSLRGANARLARKLEKKDQRIKELEGNGNALRSARLQSAFMRGVFEHRDSIDLEAAWDLANYKGFLDAVKVEDDGSVDPDGMTEALEKLVARYPYLIQESESLASHNDGALLKTRQPRPKPHAKTAVDHAALERRFPALRRAVRGRRT